MRMHTPKQRPGILLIDILIGISVFTVIVGGLMSGLAYSHRSVISSGERIRAVYFAEEALEAVRSIRDQGFDNLTDGTHGVVRQGGLWTFSGTEAVTGSGFTTSATVTTVATDRKTVIASTHWDFGPNRNGTVELSTEVTNWRKDITPGDWTSITLEGAYTAEDTPLFNAAVAVDDYLYVTSETSDGGDGLYVFDISDTSNPTRVADSYTLSDPGYAITEYGGYLFVVIGDGTEVNVYDISTPSSLSAGDIVDTINVGGNSSARGMFAFNNTLFVTTVAGGSAKSVSTYDISDIDNISSLGTYDDGETYYDIAVVGDYAYAATGTDTAELRIIDVSNPASMGIPTSSGSFNLTDTADAFSVSAENDYALIGRANVDIADEIALFDITPAPLSGNGPWYLEAGAAVNSVDMDPAETYGFIASENDGKEFSVIDIATFATGGNPEVANYDTDTGVGRGVHYSWDHDRAFLLTNTAVLIFAPSS